MNVITLEELSKITGYGVACIRSYLQGYRFTRFEDYVKVNKRTRLVYRFDQEFVDEFTKFIWERKCLDVKHKLQKNSCHYQNKRSSRLYSIKYKKRELY